MFDPEAWVKLLQEYQVEYVMVGGFAANLHGARRPTMDIDVVRRWERHNLERMCDALRSVNAVSTTGPATSGTDITPDVLVDREVMTWQTDLGRIDTLMGIPNSEGLPVDFRQLTERAERADFASATVVFASLEDVITSKEFAGRRKDAEALPELRSLRDGKRGRSSASEPGGST